MTHLWHLLAESVHDGTVLHTPSRDCGPVTGPELLDRAERTAGALLVGAGPDSPDAADSGRPVRRAGLLMANGEPWVRGLLALLRLDAAAVPLALPVAFGGVEAYAEHIRRISEDASLDAILVDGSVGHRILNRIRLVVPGLRIIDIAEPPADHAELPPTGLGGDTPAVIQYTSGSTSAPKGVVLGHAAVSAGLDAIASGTEWSPEDHLGLWLPLFHDMGLFTLLNALRRGSRVHLWQPGDFVRRPLRWLAAFAEAGATAAPAPNFFYDHLTAAAAAEGLPDGLDLSRWRLAGNGSEPVQLRSLHAFQAAFGPAGLRPQVVQPQYGLAEATLIVSTGRPFAQYRSIDVDRLELTPGAHVTPLPADHPQARSVVSCGTPVDGVRVRIAHPDRPGQPLPAGTVGEVQISGPSVTSGYLGLAPEQQPFSPDGWLRTGDIGFQLDGELYVVGRIKAMAIVHGHNYYAEDVEDIVRNTPGVDRRHCAAFAWGSDGDERMVVLWETKLDPGQAAEVSQEIRTRLAGRLGLGSADVCPVAPSSIPFTSSGKVKRSAAALLYREPATTAASLANSSKGTTT
ncbi:fatty-acyl-CoA synthase [Kitasatospora sp. MAA4]|uniref:AMP-binding protein n=1 Tax=Kitasatospora sp. MAA4 TaxID=3035093 RepID=UPI002473B954|nr:AMP-binding protein [Kitasatospora sp. MAA4]MDH6134185.1 fatty-acyl-CoA synthase [Kitasatospora sp. MAA4]